MDRVIVTENIKKAFRRTVSKGYKGIAPAIIYGMSETFVNTPEIRELLDSLQSDSGEDKKKIDFLTYTIAQFDEIIRQKDEEIERLSTEAGKSSRISA